MLEKVMIDHLNHQLNVECYSFHLYLQMSAWCADKGFSGTARFLQQCAQEECIHLQKLFNYISETGALPIIGTVNAPPYEFSTLSDLFQQIYEHEQSSTDKINQLAHNALTTRDYATFNFLQWYIVEQQGEEKLWRGLLDRLELVGDEGSALFLIDQELGQRAQSAAR